jgi:hypothetical protein
VFNGAILADDESGRCARVGIVAWEADPVDGGSPYKLERWPSLSLESRIEGESKLIRYFESRFEELWSKGHDYKELSDAEQVDPRLVREVWMFDGRPFLLVYPHRRVPDRNFPVMAYEDVMALRELDAFLKRHRASSTLLPVQLPDRLEGTWFPAEATTRIDAWPGMSYYICSKVLPPAFRQALAERGFPYEFRGVGTAAPSIYHRTTQLTLDSPTDRQPPHPSDFSLVAKLYEPERARFAYIVAGIRAMGTWGAARYLVEGAGIKDIARKVQANGFAALAMTSFQPDGHELAEVKLFIAPEKA